MKLRLRCCDTATARICNSQIRHSATRNAQACDVSVSYRSKDTPLAVALVNAVKAAGATCWYAARNLPQGCAYSRLIPEVISCARLFVLVLTENADASEVVQREMALATQSHREVLPVRFDLTAPPINLKYWLVSLQWMQFDPKEGYRTITNELSRRLGKTARHATFTPTADVTVTITRFAPFYLGLSTELDPSAMDAGRRRGCSSSATPHKASAARTPAFPAR